MAGKMFDVRKLKKAIKKKQATINKNSKKLKSAPKYILAGWDKSSGTYPEQGGKLVMDIARYHEHGTEHISAKNMLAITKFNHQDEWADKYRKLATKALSKGKVPDYYKISETVGKQMKKDIESYVYSINLVDTQRLANSVIVKYRRR